MLLWVTLFVALLWVALWLWREARLSRARAQRQSPEATIRAAAEAAAAALAAWNERFAAEYRDGPPLAHASLWDTREATRAELRALGALKRRAWVDSLEGRRWVAARLWYALT